MKERPYMMSDKYWPRSESGRERYLSDLELWCDMVERELERVRLQYKEACHELRFPCSQKEG